MQSAENVVRVGQFVLANTALYSALLSSQDFTHVLPTVQSWTLTEGDISKSFTATRVFLMRSHWNFSRWLQGRPTTVPSLSIYRLQLEVCWRLRDLEMTFNLKDVSRVFLISSAISSKKWTDFMLEEWQIVRVKIRGNDIKLTLIMSLNDQG